ncbi:MAG TPA: serine hydrolase [Thermomicrobiales bacterium]|nr:serine hydrolase [Thermomicrobiales bacterium]
MGSDFMRELGEVAESARERWGVPGLAIGVLRDGEVETAAFGVTSLETMYPLRPDSLFQIGSNSKVYTTTLLMSLVDEGKVDLDALVSDYLPELRLQDEAALGKIVVRHLVTHQSGIWGDYFDDFGWGEEALARSVEGIAELTQMYAPGELWAYTNSGFNLAGRIIEKVTGQTFENAMRERVLKPLGLERSFYLPHEVFSYPHAVGHTPEKPGDDDIVVAREFWLHRAVGPAGGIHAPVADVLEFDRFHLGLSGAQVISEDSRLAMQTTQRRAANFSDEWGLGWRIQYIDGTKVLNHSGGTNGFITKNMIEPEKGVAWAIFTNSLYGGAAIRPIERWLLEHVAGLADRDPDLISMSGDDLARFAGRYTNPLSEITVAEHDGGLRVQSSSISISTNEMVAYPPVDFKPVSDRIFMATEGREEGMLCDFILHEDGSVRFIRYESRLAFRE